MVLNDIADRASLFVEFASPGNSEGFRHGDLDAVNVVSIPDGLKERIGEAEEKQVLDRFLPKVVVNTEDAALGKRRMQNRV